VDNKGSIRRRPWFKTAFGEEAVLSRRTLTDAQWDRIEPLVPGKATDRGVTGRNNRLFVDAVLWIARTGAPWRDLPNELGRWNSTFRRFARWSAKGVWQCLFETLAADPDFEYVILDATIVRAHQHSAGGKGGLKLRPSAVPVVASRPSCTSRSTRSATPCASG
jgi:putative transposase